MVPSHPVHKGCVVCGDVRREVWCCQAGSVVMPGGKCGAVRRAVWCCQAGSVVLSGGQCGDVRRAVW